MQPTPPPPPGYKCAICNQEDHHWIADCPLVRIKAMGREIWNNSLYPKTQYLATPEMLGNDVDDDDDIWWMLTPEMIADSKRRKDEEDAYESKYGIHPNAQGPKPVPKAYYCKQCSQFNADHWEGDCPQQSAEVRARPSFVFVPSSSLKK